MANANEPPPRPPPHGSQPRPPGSGLPEGNYDIFIVPPHSAGSGFLYLPSLQVQRNSFLAGVACTLLAVGMYTIIMPALREMIGTMMAGGGVGVLMLVIGVGVACWAWGKTQGENIGGSGFGFGGGTGSAWGGNAGSQQQAPGGTGTGPQANGHAPPPKPEAKPNASSSGWEKAREETRKREEARKREEEAKKKREEAQKAKEEAERASKAKAEKDKWEQARAREKETREREARERIAREREAREKAAKSGYKKPTARSFDGTEEEYSYRPYDKSGGSPHKAGHKSSASSISGLSDTSYAASHTTARTTPPPSQRGPYHTTDADKIQIKAVYLFSDSFPTKPLASLIANTGSVTDGLILRLKTEGLFIDDDVRGVPQREWDVKAWTIKGVEDGMYKIPYPPSNPSSGGAAGLAAASKAAGKAIHVLRATTRDAENKKYTFILDESEAWKVAVGLGRLRKGSQVRALGMNGMKENEVKGLLGALGWI